MQSRDCFLGFRNNDKFDQIVDCLEKLNTFFNTVSQSWNRFSNIVSVTITGMACHNNLPLDKLVGEIRVTTDIRETRFLGILIQSVCESQNLI